MSACEAIKDKINQHQLHIQLGEHFDYRSIHSFRQFSKERFKKDTEVIIDMAETRYIDSSGVALLLCLYQWVRAPEVIVTVINCNPVIENILNHSHCGNKINIV